MSVAVACGGAAPDDLGDAAPSQCEPPLPGTEAWTEASSPGRRGTLIGARGGTVIVNVGDSGFVSDDGGVTWAEAVNPGPQDAGPLYPLLGMLADPRTTDGAWLLSDPGSGGSTYRRTTGANFVYTPLGWPVAPDYLGGGSSTSSALDSPDGHDGTVPRY